LHDAAPAIPPSGSVVLTSMRGGASESLAAYAAMGFPLPEFIEMPV
jgi:hypothetical protein